MKFLLMFLVVGSLAISCNNPSPEAPPQVDSLESAPSQPGADTTVTDPLTRTDSTQKTDTLKK